MKIEFSKTAKKQFTKLNPRIQQKIIFTLEKFESGERIDIKKLKGPNDEFRIRTGNYRVQIERIKDGFLVTKIGKRENFYMVFF